MKAIDTLNTAGVPLWDCIKKRIDWRFFENKESNKMHVNTRFL